MPPGSTYETKWEQFTHLHQTQDSLRRERRGMRRWLLLPYIAFIVPIDDPVVQAQLIEWQNVFRSYFSYDPPPPDRLHITLHYVGLLRRTPWLSWLPNAWRSAALPMLAARVQPMFESCVQFDVGIGPLNAFSNVLFAEIQDDRQCLRRLRLRLKRALPLRARPPTHWSYLPHVTLGYWGQQAAPPITDALRRYRSSIPLTFRVTCVKFTVYTRDVALRQDVLAAAQEEIIAEFRLRPT